MRRCRMDRYLNPAIKDPSSTPLDIYRNCRKTWVSLHNWHVEEGLPKIPVSPIYPEVCQSKSTKWPICCPVRSHPKPATAIFSSRLRYLSNGTAKINDPRSAYEISLFLTSHYSMPEQ